MKGLLLSKAGAPFELVSDIEKPSPGPKQVLVKSLYVGINPVDTYMQMGGILIQSWPIVIGCDASGVVVEVGKGVTKLKKGDGVYGCTRLGTPGYCTFQEYFLMDEHLAFLKSDHLSFAQAASLGVGTLTASLGLVAGTGLRLPKKGEHPKFDEWVIILGGAGTVGQFAVQLAKRCGYKVLATCSASSEAVVKSHGADATIDYKLDAATQLAQVSSLTGGAFTRVYDTTAASATSAISFLSDASHGPSGTAAAATAKRFSTVNDWEEISKPDDISTYAVTLGAIGQADEHAQAVTADIASYIPYLETYIAEGSVKPVEIWVVGEGFAAVEEALKIQGEKGSRGGKKIVVKLQDE